MHAVYLPIQSPPPPPRNIQTRSEQHSNIRVALKPEKIAACELGARITYLSLARAVRCASGARAELAVTASLLISRSRFFVLPGLAASAQQRSKLRREGFGLAVPAAAGPQGPHLVVLPHSSVCHRPTGGPMKPLRARHAVGSRHVAVPCHVCRVACCTDNTLVQHRTYKPCETRWTWAESPSPQKNIIYIEALIQSNLHSHRTAQASQR